MKYFLSFLTIACAVGTLSIYSCNQESSIQKTVNADTLTNDSLVKLGGYIVQTIGCSDCHSPKVAGPDGMKLDNQRLLSGYPGDRPVPAFKSVNGSVTANFDNTMTTGPWGTTFSANITSDATGVGNWTLERFSLAMTHGQFRGIKGSRKLLPTMPWQNFSHLSPEHIKAIFAYLKTVKAVNNNVPAYRPPVK